MPQLTAKQLRLAQMRAKFKRGMRRLVQTAPCWPLFKDKYRSPDGYQDWNDVAAAYIEQARLGSVVDLEGDEYAQLSVDHINKATPLNPPAIFIAKEMLDALCKTEVPALDAPPNEVWPAFFVMLPRGMVVGEDGELISSLLVSPLKVLDPKNEDGVAITCSSEEGKRCD